MSAWIVSKRHIDFIVTAILRSEAVPEAGTDPDEIGRVLWRENHRSVNYRYSERTRTPRYTYTPVELPTHDLAYLHKQVACYQYQTCERPDWEHTDAYRWTQALREMWMRGLGLNPDSREDREALANLPAWDAAPWGIENDTKIPTASPA